MSMASKVRRRAPPRYISHFTQSGVAGWFGSGGDSEGGSTESDSAFASGSNASGGSTTSGGDPVAKAPTALQLL